MRRRRVGELTRKEWLTAFGTGAAGLVNGAGLMVLATPGLLGINAFWEFYVLTGLLGAAVFPPLVVLVTNGFAHTTIAVTSRYHRLARDLAPIVGEFGLASVTAPVGVALGLALWFVFGALVIPAVLLWVGRGDPFTVPHLGLDLLVGYVIYGFSLGGFYGLLVQEPEVRRRFVRAVRPGTDQRRTRR